MKRLLFLLSLAFSLSVFSDDLDQIKSSILSDCDLLETRLSSVKSDSQTIINNASVGVAYSRQLYNWPDDVTALNDRQKEYIKGMADNWQSIDSDIFSSASNVVLLADSLYTVVSSIRTSANSITSSSDGSCNCDLTPVINAINDFKTQQFGDWHSFFTEFADVPDDVHFLKSNIESIKYTLEYIDDSVLDIKTYLTNQIPLIRNSLSSINSSLVSIDSKLDNFTNFNASVDIDLSSITNRLDTIISIESTINGKFETLFTALSNIQTSLDYNNFLLEHGFFNVTNQLGDVISSIDSITTNRFPWTTSTALYPHSPITYYFMDMNGIRNSLGAYYLPSGKFSSVHDLLSIMAYSLPREFAHHNNTFYDFGYRRFPVLTNTVGTLTRESTNFFAFFRAEIGVKGVLGDWTAQDGSYYDFLTNHYITVVNGGSLSAGQSSKTNWFSRIETLLAALVFADGESTNTVSSSDSQNLQNQVSSSFQELTAGPQNEMAQTLETITPSVIAQVRRFSSVFSSAALPSEVTLFSKDGDDGFNIGFEISGDSVYYDLFRNVTTLCWSLVGLFVVYRFLVWSITQIVNLVQFCFNVFTDIFKAR